MGSRLFELYYFQVLKMEALHCDPHWGNYLFRADGTIGLLDFGCVKFLPAEFVKNLRETFLFPGPRDSKEFAALIERRYGMRGQKLSKAVQKAHTGFAENFYAKFYPWEPDRENELFDFSDKTFLQDYMREAANLSKARGGALPEYVMLARAEMGLYQTLLRLRSRVQTTAIVRRYL